MTSPIKSKSIETGPVLICFGAIEHRLTLRASEDSPWFNQNMAVHAIEDGAGEPVKISPEGYQIMGSSGVGYSVKPPADGEERGLKFFFKSEYTALPYCLEVELGHFLRKFGKTYLSRRFPKINDEVHVTAEILSVYTDKNLADVDVYCFVDGEFWKIVQTDAAGVCSATVVFSEEGDHKFEFQVHSPLDDSVTNCSFDLTVFEGDAWDEAKWTVNGQVVPKNKPLFLRRGQSNELKLEVSFLVDEELSLIRRGGGLGETLDPDYGLGNPGVSGTYRWVMDQAVPQSGVHESEILSKEIEQPYELKAFMMSTDLKDEVKTVQIDGSPFLNDVVLFLGTSYTITLDYQLDSPARNYPLDLTAAVLSQFSQDSLTVVPVAGRNNEWTVTANKSCLFNFVLLGLGFDTALTTNVGEAKERRPSLRFYYGNASQYAPLPPEVVDQRVNNWYGVDLKLTDLDGSPLSNVPATIYRPEKAPVNGHTDLKGVMLGFPTYQYTTPGARIFEAVATLPDGEVRATYLINVQP